MTQKIVYTIIIETKFETIEYSVDAVSPVDALHKMIKDIHYTIKKDNNDEIYGKISQRIK